MMEFVTSVQCIDGRIQIPLIDFIKNNCAVKYIDCITEPGPCKILAEDTFPVPLESILRRINVSIQAHDSKVIFLSAHHDCKANPVEDEQQLIELDKAADFLRKNYPGIKVVKLWIDKDWTVTEV